LKFQGGSQCGCHLFLTAHAFGQVVVADIPDHAAALVSVLAGADAGVGLEYFGKPALILKATAGGYLA